MGPVGPLARSDDVPGYRIRIDPEERETHALAALSGALTDARVLEIGCGNGRLTWRYAAHAKTVLAIDNDPAAIEEARSACPDSLRGRVEFACAGVEDLACAPSSYDVAILAWSL
jgi:2-polyprenyl-3-methyl-5-hydroxy-6-metoxy-1,4-benzoquinol methylase